MTAITMVRGETLDLAIEVLDPMGVPVPLSGFTIVWRTSSGVERSTIAGTISIIGNRAILRLLPADTLALPNHFTRQFYEAKAVSPAGVVRRIVAGELVVHRTWIDRQI